MKKQAGRTRHASTLRRQAEQQLKGRVVPKPSPATKLGATRLVYELEVHQLELELQNEELKATRLQLEAGLRRYTEVFDFAPIGYATLDKDGRIEAINHMGTRLLRRDRASVIGALFHHFIADRHLPTLRLMLSAAARSGVRESCTVDLVDATGQARVLRLSAAMWEQSEPTFLLAFEDITEQQQHETQLAEAERALREADARKDQFLAALSHELRNPLAPIRSSLHVLSRGDPGSESYRRAREVIERQTAQLSRLIEDLLDLSRIKRGKIELRRGDVELTALVKDVVEDHRSNFEAAGIRLAEEITGEELWVDGDHARLVQMVSNLLGNAEKFTTRGGWVEVELRREDARALLRVRDNGIGISPEMLKELFVPFNQLPQPSDRARGGLGLGLAMVKGLVELHGGAVGIASGGPGLGTELTLSLPLQPSRAPQPSPPPAPLNVQQRRVLVIDDNTDLAETLRDALELGGHDVYIAFDGPSGLELARRIQPQVIICDIGLPGMDGYEVARTLRHEAQLKGTHLVALTCYTKPEDRQRALEAGFDDHLAKPPDISHLDRMLANVELNRAAPSA